MNKRRIALFSVFSLLAIAAFAAAFWEGTAVASGYGEFPQAGLYGACSSFPRNTLIEVQNLENGKTVQVIVTKGLENPGVFVALSPEAATELGVGMGMVARVRVSIARSQSDAVTRSDSPGMNADPDLNPAALVSRERAKTQPEASPKDSQVAIGPDQGRPTPAPTQAPSPAATAAPSPSTAPLASAAPRATPAPSSIPWPTAKPIDAGPVAITDKRNPPGTSASVGQPKDLPPVQERTPLAVEAKTDTQGLAVDVAPSYTPARSKSPSLQEMALDSPEALAYATGDKRAERERAFALKEPLLESLVARESLAKAQPYERSPLPAKKETAIAEVLADPFLAPKGMPESALVRLKSPASSPLAIAKPDAGLEEKGDEKIGGLEVIARVPLKPNAGNGAASLLASPELGAPSDGGPSAEDRLLASRKESDSGAIALAEPGIGDLSSESATADERLLASQRAAARDGLALQDPSLGDAGTESASAYERLLASRSGTAPNDLALADPEVTTGTEEAATADERLTASMRQSQNAGLALADPELESATAEDRLLASRREGAATELSLAEPAWGTGTDEEATVDERVAASMQKASGLSIAMSDPELDLAPLETANAEDRLIASKRPAATLEARIPDPDTDMVDLIAASQRPPTALETDRAKVAALKGAEGKVALAAPELGKPEAAAVPDTAVAVADRQKPGAGKAAPSFGKTAPELIAQAEKPKAVDQAKPVDQTKPLDQGKVEVVDSNRKPAEAAKAELAAARRIDALAAGISYIQVGVFKTTVAAAEAFKKIGLGYPLSYQEYQSKGVTYYRAFVGPLKKDESGIVLYRVKALGYKDAFVKTGE
jgi:hypothetical protein